jgi:trimeric autotransporter adhesin
MSISGGVDSTAHGVAGIAVGAQSRVGFDENSVGNTAIGLQAWAGVDVEGVEYATAIGAFSRSNGVRATALGHLTEANFEGSTAIGAGAKTTRANQVMLGHAGNTYTLAGLASADSLAAQSGPVRFVTSDASGNLAVSDFDVSTLATATSVGALKSEVDANRTESRQGIAAAIALANAAMPSAPGRTSWAANVGHFKGESAFGGSLSHRLDFDNPFAISLGYSYGGGDSHAARFGLMGEF